MYRQITASTAPVGAMACHFTLNTISNMSVTHTGRCTSADIFRDMSATVPGHSHEKSKL